MKKLFLLLVLLPMYLQGCVVVEEVTKHVKTRAAWAGNYGSSIEGKDANVTFVHTSAVDSAHVVFGYPDTTNWYDSVFTYPVAWGSSKIMNGAGLDLDSIGLHVVKVRYYSGGAVAGHSAGVWLHQVDVQDNVDSILVLSENLAYFYGACDSCYEIHFPEDGTASKDSSYLINPGLSGSDTLVAKVEFRHSNVVDVADSSYYYLNPWWE